MLTVGTGWGREDSSDGLGGATKRADRGLRGRAIASLGAGGLVADRRSLRLVGGLTHPVAEFAVKPS
jgi:hypothetical protein